MHPYVTEIPAPFSRCSSPCVRGGAVNASWMGQNPWP